MFPPFDEKKAREICMEIAKLLEDGTISVKNVTQESIERKDAGIMLGVLACTDENGDEKILYSLSGTSRTLAGKCRYDFVNPIVSPEEIKIALEKNDNRIHELTEKIKKEKCGPEKEKLKAERKILTDESLKNVIKLYSFHCIDGKKVTLEEICGKKLPPTGTGECAAAKLIDYAIKKGFKMQSMAEVFIGKDTEHKKNMQSYPPCDERCGLIFPYMLGIKIIYRDKSIIVVDKQSGLLSVPGRGPDKADCIVSRVKRLYPDCIEQPSVHRLDMETSGLLVLAFTKEAHKNLSKQFEDGKVSKRYVALIDGVLHKKGIPSEGESELYFRLDVDNRPHQIWDETYGKKAITKWKILDVEDYKAPDGNKRPCTRVQFTPITGRTHQLRLASSDIHGFGMPIIGDTLYGRCDEGERLMLHAEYIRFTHPETGEIMEFNCKADF